MSRLMTALFCLTLSATAVAQELHFPKSHHTYKLVIDDFLAESGKDGPPRNGEVKTIRFVNQVGELFTFRCGEKPHLEIADYIQVDGILFGSSYAFESDKKCQEALLGVTETVAKKAVVNVELDLDSGKITKMSAAGAAK